MFRLPYYNVKIDSHLKLVRELISVNEYTFNLLNINIKKGLIQFGVRLDNRKVSLYTRSLDQTF